MGLGLRGRLRGRRQSEVGCLLLCLEDRVMTPRDGIPPSSVVVSKMYSIYESNTVSILG